MQTASFSILPVSNLHAFERFHMGIALLALSGLFQGLSSFHRATPAARTAPAKAQPGTRRLRPVWTTRHATCSAAATRATSPVPPSTAPALRVLRVTESGHRVNGAGRMVISGRMADVCAELDRLAALEAAQARH